MKVPSDDELGLSDPSPMKSEGSGTEKLNNEILDLIYGKYSIGKEYPLTTIEAVGVLEWVKRILFQAADDQEEEDE